MNLLCRRNDLLEAVALAERAVAQKSTMYILEGIYLEAKDNSLKFISTNLDLSIDCFIPAEVKVEGRAVIKANLFTQAVRKLPEYEEDAEISIDEKNILTLVSGNAKFDFSTFNADEFPAITQVDEERSFEIKEYVLKSMIKKTQYAVSQNDSKPALTGILFDIHDNTIYNVGCDGYRVAIRKESIDTPDSIKFIVPGKTTKELINILGETDICVKFIISRSYALIKLKNCEITTRLLDGEFIDYNGILKHENTLMITAETRKIINSIDRASLIISETTKTPVVLKIQDDSVNIDCETVIGKVKDKFSVNMNGEPMMIAFNPRFLMEAFRNTEAEEIKFSFSTPVTPAVIEPVEGDSFKFIVLPVRI